MMCGRSTQKLCFRAVHSRRSWTVSRSRADAETIGTAANGTSTRSTPEACVHCKIFTYAHRTPLVMQTGFKTSPPPFLEEIQREMRVVVQEADHIVFMGYSLPADDLTYRAFLAARIRKDPEDQVRRRVVGKEDNSES